MYGIGLDIGYSSLKLAMGDLAQAAPLTVMRPGGAGPIDSLVERLAVGDTPSIKEPVVLIGNERWVAGVEQSRLQGVTRVLDQDYSSSKAYKALFHAALLETGRDRIDVLVTGLPTKQYQDKSLRTGLRDRLIGEHRVATGKVVRVEKAFVFPQPAGGWLDLCTTFTDIEVLERGRAVVLDPGLFSFDWAVFEKGDLRTSSSDTSLNAMSVVIEQTTKLMAKRFDCNISIDRLETAIRNGDKNILIFGRPVNFWEFLNDAARTVAEAALMDLKRSMRTENDEIDLVLLVGGGAENYREAASAAFPRSRIVVTNEPVLSNARGFWQYARGMA